MKFESAFKQALFAVVRIRTLFQDGETRHGTGFVFEYVTDDNTFPFLVTSKELVNESVEGRLALMQADGKEPRLGKGYTLDIDQFSKLWYSHPDSQLRVSITPFVPFVRHIENTGIRIFFNAFVESDMMSESCSSQLDLGTYCHSIGFPAAYWDRKSLLPMTRTNEIASVPALDYGGRHQLLLDRPCGAGWLGAPVVGDENGHKRLMGMLCSSHQSIERLTDTDEELPQEQSMSIMIKNEAISETIAAYLKEKGFI